MNFSKTKKLFIVALLVALIPAQTQAWSFSDVTNFLKKSGQTIAIVAASFASVAAIAAVVNYFFKAKPAEKKNTAKAAPQNKDKKKENIVHAMPIHENAHNKNAALKKDIDLLERDLTKIVEQINNPRKAEHHAALINRLHSTNTLLYNLHLRCSANLFDILKLRYEKLTTEARFEPATINRLYEVLGFRSHHAVIRASIQTIRYRIEDLSEQERSENLIKLLIKTVGNPFAKENYDAYLKGRAFTQALEISDPALQKRISVLFEYGNTIGLQIQKRQQEVAPMPAPQAAVVVNQNDAFRAPIAQNDLAQSIIESDLNSVIPNNDLKASREDLDTPVAITKSEIGTSTTPRVTVAPISARIEDNAKKDEKVAAEAIDFNEMFEQTRSKVNAAIAQAEKTAAQKEVTEQELSNAIEKLEQLRTEVSSYPTEHEDLKTKYEANFRNTPDIKPTEAYKALIRLNALNENEDWQELDAKTLYQRIQTRIAVMRSYQAAETKLHELRQLGYIFRNDIMKATYDAFINQRSVNTIDSKRIAELSQKISDQKAALDARKQQLASKQEDGEEYEYVEKVGRPSRPDFVTRTVRIPQAQIAAHAPLAVVPQPPAPAPQQSYMSILYDAVHYLFKR